jgi:hypothetical protein
VAEPVQFTFLVRESEQAPGMAEFVRDAVTLRPVIPPGEIAVPGAA